MDITLYRYRTGGARWDGSSLINADFHAAVNDMNTLPFQGYDEDRKYGFAQCGFIDNVIYGLFVQKFPTTLIDYDSETKDETIQSVVDSGEYLFIFFPKTYELYLQIKRSADLPGHDDIIKKFIAVAALANQKNKFSFEALHLATDEIDRDRIINIFYNEADSVTELELEDFDTSIIHEQESKRGSIQKYFNPRDEFQEALKEASLKFAEDTGTVRIKAKKGASFQKDPIARGMLEGSRKPVKIVYQKQAETITEYSTKKTKEVIHIEVSEFNLENQIDELVNKLKGQRNIKSTREKVDYSPQAKLFNEE